MVGMRSDARASAGRSSPAASGAARTSGNATGVPCGCLRPPPQMLNPTLRRVGCSVERENHESRNVALMARLAFLAGLGLR